MDFLTQGIPLGRWFGIKVVLSWLFLMFAAFQLVNSGPDFANTAVYMALLFGVVLLHEFGHSLSCLAVGGESPMIVLWPLGGLAFVQPPPKAWKHLVTTVCGPLVNALLWPAFFLIFKSLPEEYVHAQSGFKFYIANSCYMLWKINRFLLLFNLIPAYPMDGGRILQELLWMTIGYGRSLMIAGMIGTVAGAAFVAIGFGFYEIDIPSIDFSLGQKGMTNSNLIFIGLMSAMSSFGIYRRSQEIESWRKN